MKQIILILALLFSLLLCSSPIRQQLFDEVFKENFENLTCVPAANIIDDFNKKLEFNNLPIYERNLYKLQMTQYLSKYQTYKLWDSFYDTSYKICQGSNQKSKLYEPSPDQNETQLNLSLHTTMEKYPYFRDYIDREKTTQLFQHIPLCVKQRLRMVRYTIIGGKWFISKVVNEIYTYFWLEDVAHKLPPLDFLMTNVEVLYQKQIMRCLNGTQSEIDGWFQLVKKILIVLPQMRMSKGLHQPLQFNKFLIPDHYAFEYRYHNALNQVQKGVQMFPWETKQNKVFWRGGDAGHQSVQYNGTIVQNTPEYYPRVNLVNISSKYPDIVDARFFRLVILQQQKYYLKWLRQSEVPIDQSGQTNIDVHLKYKYLISVDGWSAAWERVSWILWSNSVLIKQKSRYVEWFYDELVPGVHFIEVEHDLSDLLEKIKYLKDNDNIALNISKQGTLFASKKLTQKRVMSDFVQILKDFASYQKWEPSLVSKLLYVYLSLNEHEVQNPKHIIIVFFILATILACLSTLFFICAPKYARKVYLKFISRKQILETGSLIEMNGYSQSDQNVNTDRLEVKIQKS